MLFHLRASCKKKLSPPASDSVLINYIKKKKINQTGICSHSSVLSRTISMVSALSPHLPPDSSRIVAATEISTALHDVIIILIKSTTFKYDKA